MVPPIPPPEPIASQGQRVTGAWRRLRPWRSTLCGVALFLALTVAACGPVDTNLPTHRDLDNYPGALLEGILRQSGDCLYASTPDGTGRWLLVWPRGFSLKDGTVLDGAGRAVAAIDQAVVLGGGEYHESQYDFLQEVMDGEVPESCRGGEYWLVATVATAPLPAATAAP